VLVCYRTENALAKASRMLIDWQDIEREIETEVDRYGKDAVIIIICYVSDIIYATILIATLVVRE